MKNLLSASALLISLSLVGCATSSKQESVEGSLVVTSLSSKPAIATSVIADQGSTMNEMDKVHVLDFALSAKRTHVQVDEISVSFSNRGSGRAIPTIAFLYEGANQIEAATVNKGVAVFKDLDFVVEKNGSRFLHIRMDVRNATVSETVITADVRSAGIKATGFDKKLVPVVVSGSALSPGLYVRNVGPILDLVGQPSITVSRSQSRDGSSSSIVSARFMVRIKAKGDDILIGTQSAKGTFGFNIYENGVPKTLSVPLSASFVIPTSGVSSANSQDFAFKLPENKEAIIPVDFVFEAKTLDGKSLAGNYSVELDSVRFSVIPDTTHVVNHMAGNPSWRTPQISL